MPHLAIRSKELGTTSPRGVWLAWCFWASSYSSSFASTGLGTEKTTHSLAIEPYAYPASPSGGNVPKLASIADPSGNASERFFFDDAGNETYRATQTAKHRLSYDALGRMSQIKTDSDETAGALVTLAYDGRSFLRQAARSPFPGQPATVTTRPTYTSDGLLMHKETSEVLGPEDPRGEGSATSDAYVLYFAGRPVGILENETVTPLGGGTTSSSTLTYLTTDHLGTPVLATDDSGATIWAGGFEPFGADWQAQAGTGASEAGVFLRFPGQWDDAAWSGAGAGAGAASASDPGLYYNVHRWYEYGTGRYGRVDPLGLEGGGLNLFLYATANTPRVTDALGLEARVDPALQPYVDCAKQAPFFDMAWKWLEQSPGIWDIRPIDQGPNLHKGRTLPRDKNHGTPDCKAGGRIFPDDRRREYFSPEAACRPVVESIAHEVIEVFAFCYLNMDDNAAHTFVERGDFDDSEDQYNRGVDDSTAEIGCRSCKCKRALGR